jgi:hypothetical protein
MGYWEQTGVANMKERQRKAKLRAEGRIDWQSVGTWAFVVVYCALFWFVTLYPLWAFTWPLVRAIFGHGQSG